MAIDAVGVGTIQVDFVCHMAKVEQATFVLAKSDDRPRRGLLLVQQCVRAVRDEVHRVRSRRIGR